ncbi:hypothetical protein LDENG_00024170 [Lucifuga dentata]|nr:hypothetical protein LDENG_00024170 [Lucifuga dentata]
MKILEKGPEYLRKQMELESETKEGMSAVERLAASKLNYVKSQHVVNSSQEPVISLVSPSVSSIVSSNWSSNRDEKHVTGGAQSCSPEQDVVRRSSSKKRPDSILLYRQKCELLRGSTNHWKHNQTKKLLLRSVGKNAPLPEATDKECKSEGSKEKLTVSGADDVVKKPGNKRVAEVQRRSGKPVSRSQSDISSRYSKNFADFDAFFKYCGLDGEVIESLGKENFSARSDEPAINIRSVSVSTSDDDFSRNSDDSDGLLEDELQKKVKQGTSVIERNARIIKWLYSCKNAKETGKKLRDLD